MMILSLQLQELYKNISFSQSELHNVRIDNAIIVYSCYLLRDLSHLPRKCVLDSTDGMMSETVCYLKSDVEKK